MAKKSDAKAQTKKAKGKASSAEQMKIPNTGRIDAKPAIEKAGQAFQTKVAAVDQAEVERDDAQKVLTQALIDSNVSEYVYEGKDGIMYCAYIPKKNDPKAKVRKIKRNKPDLGDGEQ
jgi:hypothetical protein